VRKIVRLLLSPSLFFRKVLHRIPSKFLKNKLLKFPEKSIIDQQIKNIFKSSDRVVIFPSPNCPWGYLFQRPQQLARAFAKRGIKVVYLVDTSFSFEPDWSVRGFKQIDENIYLYNDNCEGRFLFQSDYFCCKEIIIWQYWPHQHDIVSSFKETLKATVVYDCIDHLETFISYSTINAHHDHAIRTSRYVIATAKGIYDDIKKIRPDCMLLPNGVTYEDFRDIEQTNSQNDSVTIGYYGAIAEWFDFDIVEKAAKQYPQWKFVIVGEVYLSVVSKVKILSQLENIKFLPRVNYSEIPTLLSSFDIAMLPFKINQITNNTSPVKVFEYLAGGKITVSTALPEIINLFGVLIANDDVTFQQNIFRAIELSKNADYIEQLKDTAKEHSWDNRVNTFLQLYNEEREVID